MTPTFPYAAEESAPCALSGINTTPLVDVMLVLLIIVLITVPVAAALPPVAIPPERAAPVPPETASVTLSLTADGRLFWNETELSGEDDLSPRLAALATASTPLNLRADGAIPYERIARLVALCRAAGLARLGFLTDPHAAGGGAEAVR